MTLVSWHETFANGREEDELLLEWLRYGLPHLSMEEKRTAVRRLCNEFGHTTKGLAGALGLSESTIRSLRASDEAVERARVAKRDSDRRAPRVGGRALLRVADRWEERAAGGLSAGEASELLCELRALVPVRRSCDH